MKIYCKNRINIYMTERAYFKIKLMVEESKIEVGALGSVTKHDEGTYIIRDVFIPGQEANAVTCELKPGALLDLAMNVEDPNSIRCWIHSHVDMDIIPSGQDERQLRELSEGCDYFIAGIHNKKGEIHYCLYEGDYIYDYVKVTVMPSNEFAALKEELEKVERQMDEYKKNHEDMYRNAIKKQLKEQVETKRWENAVKEAPVLGLHDQFVKNIETAWWEMEVAEEKDVPLHRYFEEYLSLEELFSADEVAAFAMCKDAHELREYLDVELMIMHDWTDAELTDILNESSFYAMDTYEVM